jgi:hypothetical protein
VFHLNNSGAETRGQPLNDGEGEGACGMRGVLKYILNKERKNSAAADYR